MRRIRLTLLVLFAVGCRGQFSDKPAIHPQQNMFNQERYDPQEANPFFADGRANRPLVPGTVSREGLRLDTVLYQGRGADGRFVKNNPLPITMELLQRGRERYNIFCAQCHDRAGTGQGMVLLYPRKLGIQGFPPPSSYHEDRIRNYDDGQFFDVIAHGIRTMPSYAAQVPPRDRWAIVAYLRALQRSQNASREDVPRDKLDSLVNR